MNKIPNIDTDSDGEVRSRARALRRPRPMVWVTYVRPQP